MDAWDTRRVMTVASVLLDEAWPLMESNLARLTDAEYFWEPVPGCWGVRRRAEVASPDCWGAGEWVVEHCFDGSVSPPMATIGWRLMHAYDCTNDFTGRVFGDGEVDWNDIEVSGTADGAVALLTAAVSRLRSSLAAAPTDAVLLEPGPGPSMPRWRLLDKAFVEAIAHTSEIGTLRQLYAAR